jgi:hypothetical protein
LQRNKGIGSASEGRTSAWSKEEIQKVKKILPIARKKTPLKREAAALYQNLNKYIK